MSLSKSQKYWEERFKQLEEQSNRTGNETLMRIEPSFDEARNAIQKEIEAWYGRYAINNGITMQEAKKQLTTRELNEFRWDVNEYIKYGKENALNQQWMKELENASARVHVSRLEALKLRTQQYAEKAFGNELDELDSMARKLLTDDYYHACFEVQKGFNIGWELGQLDERKLDKYVSKPWAADGKNFSDRIWNSKAQLIDEVHKQLTQSCILGKAPDGAIQAISKKFNTSKSQAGRLVMTEQAYFHSVAQQEAFNDLDVEEYEIVATLDSQTSETCREMDGKHFPMNEYKAGVTAPPFHVWCRSVTVPWFEDNYGGERAARGADGKTYYVPDDMTYPEWKNSFVKSDGLEGIREPIDIEFDLDVSGYKAVSGGHMVESIGEKYGQELKRVTIKKRNTTEWDELPKDMRNDLRWHSSMNNKPFRLAKGEYEVQRYVEGSRDCIERDEIAKSIGAEYIGYAFERKNNHPFFIDFYQKGDELFYSIGRADMKKTITSESFETVKKVVAEREKLIIERIGEEHLRNITNRKGDEWSATEKAMARNRLGIDVWEEVADVIIEEETSDVILQFENAYRELYVYVSQANVEEIMTGNLYVHPLLQGDANSKSLRQYVGAKVSTTYPDVTLRCINHDDLFVEISNATCNAQKNTTTYQKWTHYHDVVFNEKLSGFETLNFYGLYCAMSKVGTRIRVLGVRA